MASSESRLACKNKKEKCKCPDVFKNIPHHGRNEKRYHFVLESRRINNSLLTPVKNRKGTFEEPRRLVKATRWSCVMPSWIFQRGGVNARSRIYTLEGPETSPRVLFITDPRRGYPRESLIQSSPAADPALSRESSSWFPFFAAVQTWPKMPRQKKQV